MKARQYCHPPITECSRCTRQQCDALFAAGWLGSVVATSLGNSGICAKGGGQN